MKNCKDCERLSDMLFAAQERESKLITDAANLRRDLELAQSKLLQAEARREVQG